MNKIHQVMEMCVNSTLINHAFRHGFDVQYVTFEKIQVTEQNVHVLLYDTVRVYRKKERQMNDQEETFYRFTDY